MSIDMLGMLGSTSAPAAPNGVVVAAVTGADGGDFAGIMAAEVKAADSGLSAGGKAVMGLRSAPHDQVRASGDLAIAAGADGEGDDFLASTGQLEDASGDEDTPVVASAGADMVTFIPAADQLMVAAPIPTSHSVEQHAPDIGVEATTPRGAPASASVPVKPVPVSPSPSPSRSAKVESDVVAGQGKPLPVVESLPIASPAMHSGDRRVAAPDPVNMIAEVGAQPEVVAVPGAIRQSASAPSAASAQTSVDGGDLSTTGAAPADPAAPSEDAAIVTLRASTVETGAIPAGREGEESIPTLSSSGERQAAVRIAANDDAARAAGAVVPKEAEQTAPISAKPGEVTSLLAMVKSILPWRGRDNSSVTPLQTKGTVAAPAASAGGVTTPFNSLSMQALAQQTTSLIASENVVANIRDATVVTAAAAMPSLESQAVSGSVRREGVTAPAFRAESPDKAVAGEEGDASNDAGPVAVPEASSPNLADGFDLNKAGTSSLLVAAPSALSANGASVAAGSVGASLDQKVIDMGVSGQWIDDIARQIASISDNQGRGSFQIASASLGAVRVDILPGAEGSHVRLTAETEAAQVALVRDKDRLVQDAHMAAIRISEVRIDRMAPVSESQRSAASHDDGQQGSNAQAGFTQNSGQNGQQGAGQGGAAAFAGQYSGGSPKNPFTKTVIANAGTNDAQPSSREGKADSARYA